MKKFLLFAFSLIVLQLAAQVAWQKMASLPGPGRNHAIAFSHGTKGYVITGTGGGNLYKDFWEYNSITNTWAQLPDYPGLGRSFGVGYAINDKAYIGFGHTSATASASTTDWWQYDFTTSAWTQKNNFPGVGRDHPTCAVMNGMMYMGFGDNASGSINDWWQYNPSTDAWVQKTNYPGLKMHHPVTVSYNDLIYLSQGHIKDGTSNYGSKFFYSYNPTSDTWAQLADMPALGSSGVVAGASFYIGDNKIYSGVGITEPSVGYRKEFYAYDISSGTWAAIANYPGTGTFGPGSFTIGNAGYVVTGASPSSNVQDLYKLSDATLGVATVTSPDGFIIYPNPANSETNISYSLSESCNVQIAVYDVLGKEVMKIIEEKQSTGYHYIHLNTQGLRSGVYFIKATLAEHEITEKLIININ